MPPFYYMRLSENYNWSDNILACLYKVLTINI